MSAIILSIGLLLACFWGSQLPAGAQQSSPADSQNAVNLYQQHKYAAAADSFERIIRSAPSARMCYYAALSNQASGRQLRATQLFQYIITNYPNAQESAYARQALQQHQSAAPESANSSDLPESVRNALPKQVQDMLGTEMGRRAVQQVLKDNPDQIAAIRQAERQGTLNKDRVREATAALPLPSVAAASGHSRSDGDHPFTAADIARDGAAGIDQSRYPNCWFEASMASLAQLPRGQRLLASMIRLRGDNYVVRFPGDGNEYVISRSDLAKGGVHDTALWASIIECAQVQKFPENRGADGADGDQSRLEIGLGSITGAHAEVRTPGTCSEEEISSFIGGAITSQSPIVAATWHDAHLAGLPQLVITTHAYTLIGFDPSRKMITIRNPWGHSSRYHFELPGDPQHNSFQQLSDGVFTMSVPIFQKYFYSVARSFI